MTTNKQPFWLTCPMLEEGLVFLGGLLLVLGNFLPWNCWASGASEPGCDGGIEYNPYLSTASVFFVRWFVLPVLSAVAILILPLIVRRVRLPVDRNLWLLMAMLSFLLVAPRLGFARRALPPLVWDNILWISGTVLRLVLPLTSLAVLWIVNRPVALRRRWRTGLVASLGVFVVMVVLYLIYLSYLAAQPPGIEGATIRLGMGVQLILVGGLLLLYVEASQARLGQPQVDSPHS